MRGLMMLGVLLLAACASTEDLVRQSTQAHASGRSPDYVQGYEDGCTSGYAHSNVMVRASYTRDESKFRQNADYAGGWDDGRLACNFPDNRVIIPSFSRAP